MEEKKTAASKTAFCKSLPWRSAITWFDLTGMIRLDEDRLVKITLSTQGVVDDYVGFEVEVFSKHLGVLDWKYFHFNDYLPRNERADSHPNRDMRFNVWAHDGWQWYIAVPKHPEKFTDALEDYIDFWR